MRDFHTHTHDHKIYVFSIHKLKSHRYFISFPFSYRGWRTDGGGWRTLLILVQETLNDSNTFFSPYTQVQYNPHIHMWEEEATAMRNENDEFV